MEDANVKLGSVATDALGVSGRQMLKALIQGQRDPKQLAQLARGRLRKKLSELQLALEGHFTEHHGFQIKALLELVEFGEKQLGQLETKIQRLLLLQEPESRRPKGSAIAQVEPPSTPPTSPLQRAVELLDTIPGVDKVTAWTMVAEMGANMDQFGSARQLAKWAGICPGNNESAGKRLSGKTPKGNIWLRRALCEAAWAASRTKDTYLAAQYKHFIVRKGKKKTIVAVAHSMLRIAYYLLTRQCPYAELGGDFFDRLNQEAVRSRLVKKLASLGYQVTLTPVSSEATA